VHVPNVPAASVRVPTSRPRFSVRAPARPPFRLADLVRAGDAIMRAALAAMPTLR
jgi:hypothetical protein